MRPALDAVLATDLLEDRGADTELLGDLVDRQVKVLRELVEGVHGARYEGGGNRCGGGSSGGWR